MCLWGDMTHVGGAMALSGQGNGPSGPHPLASRPLLTLDGQVLGVRLPGNGMGGCIWRLFLAG